MNDAKTIQGEEDVLMGVPTAASEKGLEFVIDVEKEYVVSETIGEVPSKLSLISPIPVKESNLDSLISYVNQSLIISLRRYEGIGWIKFRYKTNGRTATKRISKHLEFPSSINGYGLLNA